MPIKVIDLTVPEDAGNTRLDVWLARTLSDSSRSYLQKLIKNGRRIISTMRSSMKIGTCW